MVESIAIMKGGGLRAEQATIIYIASGTIIGYKHIGTRHTCTAVILSHASHAPYAY